MDYYDSDFALNALYSKKEAPSIKTGRVAGMKAPAKSNPWDGALDATQGILSVAGFVPGFGAIPDLINAGVSGARGDWAGAGINAIAAIPGFGDVAGAASIGKKGIDMAGKAGKFL